MKQLTLLLAEDEIMVRQGLKALLYQQPNIRIIHEAGNSDEVLAVLASNNVDIILLDVRMPGMQCILLVEQIRRNYPDVKILVITGLFGTELIFNLLKAGIHGFVQKMNGFDEIEKAIDQIMISNQYLSSDVIEIIQQNVSYWKYVPPIKLTEKEVALLKAIVSGLTTKAIAEKFDIPASSAETNRNRLMKKTGTQNTAELIAYAFRNGII
ncbi:MAG TPA: response regulator transcription factor [Chryseosolibacter sp.]|nr:response regulator transcription factor [Chryseosolibacter sp.]